MTCKLISLFVAVAVSLTLLAHGASAKADQGAPCSLTAAGGLFQGQTGVLVDGVCRAATSVQHGGPQVEYRTLSCLADGTAIVHGTRTSASGCDVGMPHCKLLVDGGQTTTNPVVAFEDQVRQAGSTVWVNLGFWCPASTAPVAVPKTQDIRDEVIRLLPHVAAVTTGPNTLVNIQTLLWADTAERRSLGRVAVIGQPVWLQLAFDHASWDFGDGTGTSSQSPGKAYDPNTDPCRSVNCPDYFGHTFTGTAMVTVNVQITWRASYSLDGQHYQRVDDTPITGPADTVQIHVRQARGILVATGD